MNACHCTWCIMSTHHVEFHVCICCLAEVNGSILNDPFQMLEVMPLHSSAASNSNFEQKFALKVSLECVLKSDFKS